MDTRTGRIYYPDQVELLISKAELGDIKARELVDRLVEMGLPPTPKQTVRKPPRVGRNEPCPCGSGKKFKKCCLRG